MPFKMLSPIKNVHDGKKKVTIQYDDPVTKTFRENEKTITETTQKGTKTTYTPPTKTPAGDAAYAAMSKSERAAADARYRAANTKVEPLSRTSRTEKSNVIPTIPKKPVNLIIPTGKKLIPTELKPVKPPTTPKPPRTPGKGKGNPPTLISKRKRRIFKLKFQRTKDKIRRFCTPGSNKLGC
jgi:hypothetical protein